jgi:hypothetical protein
MTGLLAVVLSASAGLVASAQATPTASLTTTPLASGSGPLLNGDFESGDLSSWTTFTTTNGVMIAGVLPFDTNNDGAATFSAQFVVGQGTFEGFDVQRGGGIAQNVVLEEGDLSVSADIASEFAFSFCNGDGGTIQLLVDGVVEDAHSFGDICGPTTEYASLRAGLSITSGGSHEVRFLITRAATLSGVTNFLDNVLLSGTATKSAAELLADLITLVDSYQLATLGTSLEAKLMTVQQMLADHKLRQACENLGSFLNQVNAQTGKGLTIEQASELKTNAQRIEHRLRC